MFKITVWIRNKYNNKKSIMLDLNSLPVAVEIWYKKEKKSLYLWLYYFFLDCWWYDFMKI